jgi:phospholipid/cholesterol/gamma-HCH transport system ATP-binding protein
MVIEFQKVSFSYGSRSVLREISFLITGKEKVAILGGSGEGKTTILKLILGLLRPDSGSILIDGEDITNKSEDQLREIRIKFSIVFQEGALFDSLNVKENVAFCLREYTKMSEEQIDAKVRTLLARVGMESAMDLMPEELSGGMHRRVAIMRSLAAFEPEMFLYDEPTSGLDPVNADIIYKLMTELSQEGKGFIMVTHEVPAAARVSDRFLLLARGSLIFDGNKAELLRFSAPEIQFYLKEWKECFELKDHFSGEGSDV